MELSVGLIEKLKKALSAGEVEELLKADGLEIAGQEIQQLWTELTRVRQEEDRKLCAAELEAVSGGKDRDWLHEGCCATVEPGSWCGSNDACVFFSVTYSHEPTSYKCRNCGTWLFQVKDNNTVCFRCKNCLRTYPASEL